MLGTHGICSCLAHLVGSLKEALHVTFSYNSTMENPAVSSSSSVAAQVQRKKIWGERKEDVA